MASALRSAGSVAEGGSAVADDHEPGDEGADDAIASTQLAYPAAVARAAAPFGVVLAIVARSPTLSRRLRAAFACPAGTGLVEGIAHRRDVVTERNREEGLHESKHLALAAAQKAPAAAGFAFTAQDTQTARGEYSAWLRHMELYFPDPKVRTAAFMQQ